MFRPDPGACLVCGAPHCTCEDAAPITMTQLPQRDAAAAAQASAQVQTSAHPSGLVADAVQATLPSGQVTSATYRGSTKKGR